MSEDDHTNPPTTISEVGIHIGYMRKDVNALRTTVENLVKGSPTRKEVDEIEARVDKLELFVDSIKTHIAGWAITLFVSMVLAMYGFEKWLG